MKTYLADLRDTEMNGAVCSGPTFYETETTGGFIRSNSTSEAEARKAHDLIARTFGASLTGPTKEVPFP